MYAVKQNTSLVQILRKSTENHEHILQWRCHISFLKFTGDNKKEEEERLKSFFIELFI